MKFKGSTAERKAPILGARFWKKGISLTGEFVRKFPTVNGDCFEFELGREVEFEGNVVSPAVQGKIKSHRISVGAMKGFLMAVADCGCGEFALGDRVTITCEGEKASGKGSDMVLFKVEVDRK